MKKNFVLFLTIFSIFFSSVKVFAMASSDALIGIALKYYNQGYYQEALHEFSKVLLIEPDNKEAISYIEKIRGQEGVSYQKKVSQALDKYEKFAENNPVSFARDIIINRELDERSAEEKTYQKPTLIEKNPVRDAVEKTSRYLNVSGEYQLSGGVRNGSEVIWKEANADLNERNFRILFSDTKANTFDPAIFDRLRLNFDTKNLNEVGLNNISAHLNLTIDPWSFTGKSDKFSVIGAGGDLAEFQLKYWSNTGMTINEIVNTLRNGDALALPEIKVIDGVTSLTTVKSTFKNTFVIPAVKIDRDFQPVREFWVDYKDEEHSFRFFPIAYQDQALTTDDPLGISNHHDWWDASPWLNEWRPGNLNTGAIPVDFSKGIWDNSLAFFTRDSDGLRLTALRGMAFAYNGADLKLQSTVASPKNLWEDYDNFTTYVTATRLKYDLRYNLGLGLTYGGHFGLNEGSLDATNNVFSADVKSQPVEGTKLLGQVATSEASFDRTNSTYTSSKTGNAYFVSMLNRFPGDDIYEKDYFGIRKAAGETSFLKSRFNLAHLEDGFDSTLTDYRQTREDEFWSRHITFREHPLNFYSGLTKPMNFNDIEPFAIGDGIDSGRDVVGERLEGSTKFFDRDLVALFDVRNVHKANSGAFIENVARLEVQYEPTDRLTTKFLGIRQNMHKTYAGFDPFIFDPATGEPLVNKAIPAGLDPSLGTASMGFDYKLTDYFSFNTVWEHTNDSTVAEDNYPRGLFNDSNFTTVTEDGKIYREPIPFLYSQTGFPQPPYSYFDIFKLGFSLRPTSVLEFYLDFTYNAFKQAGQIDDNMNHYGFEIAYTPTSKWSLDFKYTYSRWIDMLTLNATGQDIFQWHNNFFLESRYRFDKDTELILEYGVGEITPLGSATYDPFGGSQAVLDTQHIVRAYYKKSF